MKIFTTLIFSLLSFASFSQSLINQNLESWIDNTAFIDPEGWVTLNDFNAEFGLPITVFKTTDAQEGQYAAHLQTFTFLDGNNNTDTLPAVMVYGTDVNSGIPYAWPKRLKTVSFYYKYLPNGIDTGIMYISVGYRNKKTNAYVDQGGTYFLFTKKTDTYTKVVLPMYYSSNNKCDTFVFAFINSVENKNGNRRKPGTILKIDNLSTEWEDFPTVAIQQVPEMEISLYPNPTKDFICINGLNPGFYKVRILDNLGKIVYSETLSETTIPITNFNPGLYHLVLESDQGLWMASKYFIKN